MFVTSSSQYAIEFQIVQSTRVTYFKVMLVRSLGLVHLNDLLAKDWFRRERLSAIMTVLETSKNKRGLRFALVQTSKGTMVSALPTGRQCLNSLHNDSHGGSSSSHPVQRLHPVPNCQVLHSGHKQSKTSASDSQSDSDASLSPSWWSDANKMSQEGSSTHDVNVLLHRRSAASQAAFPKAPPTVLVPMPNFQLESAPACPACENCPLSPQDIACSEISADARSIDKILTSEDCLSAKIEGKGELFRDPANHKVYLWIDDDSWFYIESASAMGWEREWSEKGEYMWLHEQTGRNLSCPIQHLPIWQQKQIFGDAQKNP